VSALVRVKILNPTVYVVMAVSLIQL